MSKKNKKINVPGAFMAGLSEYQLARWAALYDGVNLVADMAAMKKIPFNDIHIKIPELKKYVDNTSDSIAKQWQRARS